MAIPIFSQFSDIKNFNTDAKKLIISSMIMSITMGFMFTDFPVYLKQVGYNPLVIGFLLSINVFVASFLMIFLAALSDRFGRKIFILLGRVFLISASIIYMFTYQYIYLIVAALFSGLAFASVPSSLTALLTEKTSIDDRNLVFATNSFFRGLTMAGGMMIGATPPLLMSMYHLSVFGGYRVLFLISLLGSVISFFIILSVKEGYKGTKKITIIPSKSKKFVIKLSVLGLIGLGAGILVRLFPLWFYLKFGINVNVLGPIFAISQVVTALASFTTPEIAKKLGEIKTIVITQGISIVILIILPFTVLYLAGPLFILRNVMMNMSWPIMNAFTMSMIPVEERAKGSAIIQTFDALPRAFGPTIGGYFFNIGNLITPFFITASLYGASVVAFYILFRSVNFYKKL